MHQYFNKNGPLNGVVYSMFKQNKMVQSWKVKHHDDSGQNTGKHFKKKTAGNVGISLKG